MKKPKEIKVILLLAFIFISGCFFSQDIKKDSIKPILKKDPGVFKYGISYLTDSKISRRSYGRTLYGGFQNMAIRTYEQSPLEAIGPYLSFGKIIKDIKSFSIYFGAYYTNSRCEFFYSRSFDTRLDPVLPLYKVKYEQAKGYVMIHSVGLELNFHLDIKRSRVILSPVNPTFVFIDLFTTEKTVVENEVIRKYNNGQSDSTISTIYKGKGEFDMDTKKFSLTGIAFPVYLGYEYSIPLKKRRLLIGLKGTILLRRGIGGQLYTGFEF